MAADSLTPLEHGKRGITGRRVLDTIVSLAMLVASAAVIYSNLVKPAVRRNHTIDVPREPVSLAGAVTDGDATARGVVLEFADFQCPFCASFAQDVYPALKRDYVDVGQVQFAFRHFPLTAIHPDALKASTAAICAGEQQRFWAMNALLFAHSPHLEESALVRLAMSIPIAPDIFEDCLARPHPGLAADMRAGHALNVTATPTFLIGHRVSESSFVVSSIWSGARAESDFRRGLDQLLEKYK